MDKERLVSSPTPENKPSAAKRASSEKDPILGYQNDGGLKVIADKPYLLKHANWRFSDNGTFGSVDGAYKKDDLVPFQWELVLASPQETKQRTENVLKEIKQGQMPITIGIEIEGQLTNFEGTELLSKYDEVTLKATEDKHPELIPFTVETTTDKLPSGEYPKTPAQAALALADAIGEAWEVAQTRQGAISYGSVPETGTFIQAEITHHPYLQTAAALVKQDALKEEHWQDVPEETKALYKKIFKEDPKTYLENNDLHWPAFALHVHTGVLKNEKGEIDTRAAYASGIIRQTELAKVLSFTLYGTSHIYGIETPYKDVRSIIRRLLATTHDTTIPMNAQEFLQDSMQAVAKGDIHSVARYPATGQHGVLRLRTDSETVEAIDAPMNPDLRTVLSWTYLQQILSVIAWDALKEVGGDEAKVIPYLQEKHGNLFSIVPALKGENSSYQQDLTFHKEGMEGKVQGVSYKDLLKQTQQVIADYAKKYPGIRVQAAVVNQVIEQQVAPQPDTITLAEYFGIETGAYQPNGKNLGNLADVKKKMIKQGATIADIVKLQAVATALQAEKLAQLAEEKGDDGILEFYGIKPQRRLLAA